MPDVHVRVRENVAPDIRRLMSALDPAPIWEEQGNRKVTRMVRLLGRGKGTAAQGGAPPVSRHGAAGFAGRMTYELLDGGRTLRYGNTSVQARILYLGGIIEPKPPRKALTIPLAKEAEGRRAKDFPGLFRIADILYLAKGGGKGRPGRIIAMFLLRKSVEIKPHPWGIEWDDVDRAALAKSVRRRTEKAERQRRTQ
jgi:hypothetical protein